MAQWVMDVALLLQWLRSLLWHEFFPGPELLYAKGTAKKKKKKKKKKRMGNRQKERQYKL